ncbi:MAG: DUF4435 domain-containing protein [Candidatus Saccharicenans sp.]|nr:DUF4435 domain-containing protein [Candidatus Saccharicenans sp.]HQF90343.1 DUF4435 domain-containing protein [Methanofastidiosum sp.]
MYQHVNEYTTANEVRLIRSQFKGIIIIAEGSTDVRIYKSLFGRETCRFVIAQGKENAVKALLILEKENFLGIIAIVDADFDRLDSKRYPYDNIMLTDFHDIDAMVLNSPALEKLLDEYTKSEKNPPSCNSILASAYKAAKPIGLLRWISLKENLFINFKSINYREIIDIFEFKINIDKLIAMALDQKNHCDEDKETLKTEIKSLLSSNIDEKQLCCGHDLIYIIFLAIRMRWGNRNFESLDYNNFCSLLRLAYDLSYFKSTNLYEQLKKWEENNPQFSFLR